MPIICHAFLSKQFQIIKYQSVFLLSKMDFFFSHSVKLQESFTSRPRTSNSKRAGIKVTLSKQKSSNRSKNENSAEKQNIHDFTVHQIGSANESEHKNYYPNESEYMRSSEKGAFQFEDNKSVRFDFLSSFFQKSQQKQHARKESVALDEQIRKLQLQIYNTRSKITQAKYLAKKQSEVKLHQSIQNSRKSKEKGKVDQLQTKSNKSLKIQKNVPLTLKASPKRVQQPVYPVNNQGTDFSNKSPISIIQNKSREKMKKSSDRSRSPSPPHPSILKQMLMAKRKPSAKYSNLEKYEYPDHKREISLTEQQTVHKYQMLKDIVDDQRLNEKFQAEANQQQQKSNAKQKVGKSVSKKINKEDLESNKRKSLNQTKKISRKKRSISAFSNHQSSNYSNHTKKNKQKTLLQSSEQIKKRKTKVSYFNLDICTVLKKDKTQRLNLSDFNVKKSRSSKNKLPKKAVFTNDILTKADSTVLNQRKSRQSLRKGF